MSAKNNISKLPERELLAQYKKSGENDYLRELFNRYTPLIYGVCLKYLKNAEKAQDAVIQLFEDSLKKVPHYEIESFRTWAYSMAKSYCLKTLRKVNRDVNLDFNSNDPEYEHIMYLLEEEEKEDAGSYELIQTLKQCLEKLPESQRASIIYFFRYGLSYADIVDKTGYSLNYVKSYIQNGKRNLKICLEKNSQ
jgi:RNA polymerase sigma-70 factor (ECF subfamily)